MQLLRFSAEASLYRTKIPYRAAAGWFGLTGLVPADGCDEVYCGYDSICCPTSDGGAYCCAKPGRCGCDTCLGEGQVCCGDHICSGGTLCCGPACLDPNTQKCCSDPSIGEFICGVHEACCGDRCCFYVSPAPWVTLGATFFP
jgi:hypothetical protein